MGKQSDFFLKSFETLFTLEFILRSLRGLMGLVSALNFVKKVLNLRFIKRSFLNFVQSCGGLRNSSFPQKGKLPQILIRYHQSLIFVLLFLGVFG
jgi:hypothetical protein